MSFFEWKFCILIKISQLIPESPIDNSPAFGLDNVLAPNRRQAIISNNAESIRWRTYAALVEDELGFLYRNKLSVWTSVIHINIVIRHVVK